MKKELLVLMMLSLSVMTVKAQWTVKESDFKGSPLEQVYRSSPYLVHVLPDEEWDSSNFASKDDMKWYEDARYGMYIHFGLGAYKNRDLSWGMADGVAPDMSVGAYPREEWTSWPKKLTLDKFSKEELTDIFRQSGMKYVVVVAKHHDGFHFYDTKYSDFKVTNTPYGRDFVREVLDAARAAGVKVGVYFSQRDWYHPDYAPLDTSTIVRTAEAPYFKARDGMKVRPGKSHRKYIEYMFNTVRELCTNYGKLDMFNFDASYWNGMFTAEMWDAERLTRMIRELQPGIIINNRASLPGDYDSPEQRIGMFQDRRMWETCMCLCDTWAYSPTRVKTPLEVFRNIQSAAVGNGNILLSWGMKWNGEWDAAQKQSLVGAGKLLADYGQSIYGTHGGPWMPGNKGGCTFSGNRIYVHVFDTGSGPMVLPKLKGVDVRYGKTLTGQVVKYTDMGDNYLLDFPDSVQTGHPLIVELVASRELIPDDILRTSGTTSLFDDEKNYGHPLCSATLAAGDVTVIDLGDKRMLKGLQFVSSSGAPQGRISILLSEDGKDWKLYRTITLSERLTEIPVATYVAGILAEGVETRHVKLKPESAHGSGLSCHAYGE